MEGLFRYLRIAKQYADGIAVVLVSLLLLIMIPSQVPEPANTWGVMRTLPGGHRLFPIIGLGMCLICGFILIFDKMRTIKKSGRKEEKAKANLDKLGFWITVVAWAVYGLLVIYLGYIVSTIILSIFLLRYYGIKSWPKTIICTVGLTAFVYLVFVYLLKLPFPNTALFF